MRRKLAGGAESSAERASGFTRVTLWSFVAILSVAAQAQDVSYTVAGGKVTITGPKCPIPVLVVPQQINGLPVTAVGSYAFSGGCDTLLSIALPDGIVSIGDGAFAGCASLTNIILPASVTAIGSVAFVDCSRLPTIVIPDQTLAISDSTFLRCSSLTNVTIPPPHPTSVAVNVSTSNSSTTVTPNVANQ